MLNMGAFQRFFIANDKLLVSLFTVTKRFICGPVTS